MSKVLAKIATWSTGEIRSALFLGYDNKGTVFDATIKPGDSYYPDEVTEMTEQQWEAIPEDKRVYRRKNSGWGSMR